MPCDTTLMSVATNFTANVTSTLVGQICTDVRTTLTPTFAPSVAPSPGPTMPPTRIKLCTPPPKVDMLFIIDSSGSIGEDNFKLMKQFVIDIVSTFQISDTYARVAVLYFSDNYYPLVHFPNAGQDTKGNHDSTNVIRLLAKLQALPYRKQGTQLGKALGYAQTNMIGNKCGRGINLRPCHVIVLTDGKSTDDPIGPANNIAISGATMFSVGVLPADAGELLGIAQNKPDHVMMVKDFAALVAAETVIAGHLCDPVRIPTIAPTQADTLPGDTPFPTLEPTMLPPTLEPTHRPTLSGDTPHPTMNPTHPPTSFRTCAHKPAVDLVFISPRAYVDESEFIQTKSFLDEIISTFDIGSTTARATLVWHKGASKHAQNWNVGAPFMASSGSPASDQSAQYTSIKASLKSTTFHKIYTKTVYHRWNGNALKRAYEQIVLPLCGNPPDAPSKKCVVVLLADGSHGDYDDADTQFWANKIKDYGAPLYTIGLSSDYSYYNKTELVDAAGPATSMKDNAAENARATSHFFFPLGSYSTLEESARKIGESMCYVLGGAPPIPFVNTPWPTPTPTLFGETWAPAVKAARFTQMGAGAPGDDDLAWLWWLLLALLLCCLCCLLCCCLGLLLFCCARRKKSDGGICGGILAAGRCFLCCGAPCLGGADAGEPCWAAGGGAGAAGGFPAANCYHIGCLEACCLCLHECRIWWCNFFNFIFCGCCGHCNTQDVPVWTGCTDAFVGCYTRCASCWAWFWYWLCCSWCACLAGGKKGGMCAGQEQGQLMACAGIFATCRCFFCCGAPCVGEGCGPPCWSARTRRGHAAAATASTGACYTLTCCDAWNRCFAECRDWWLDFFHWLFCGCCCGRFCQDYRDSRPSTFAVWSGCHDAGKNCFGGCASCWSWFWFWLCCSWCGCFKRLCGASAKQKHGGYGGFGGGGGGGGGGASGAAGAAGPLLAAGLEDDGEIDYLAAAMAAPILAGVPLMLTIYSEDESIKYGSVAVTRNTTIEDIREAIEREIPHAPPLFSFLQNADASVGSDAYTAHGAVYAALAKRKEAATMAGTYAPDMKCHIRAHGIRILALDGSPMGVIPVGPKTTMVQVRALIKKSIPFAPEDYVFSRGPRGGVDPAVASSSSPDQPGNGGAADDDDEPILGALAASPHLEGRLIALGFAPSVMLVPTTPMSIEVCSCSQLGPASGLNEITYGHIPIDATTTLAKLREAIGKNLANAPTSFAFVAHSFNATHKKTAGTTGTVDALAARAGMRVLIRKSLEDDSNATTYTPRIYLLARSLQLLDAFGTKIPGKNAIVPIAEGDTLDDVRRKIEHNRPAGIPDGMPFKFVLPFPRSTGDGAPSNPKSKSKATKPKKGGLLGDVGDHDPSGFGGIGDLLPPVTPLNVLDPRREILTPATALGPTLRVLWGDGSSPGPDGDGGGGGAAGIGPRTVPIVMLLPSEDDGGKPTAVPLGRLPCTSTTKLAGLRRGIAGLSRAPAEFDFIVPGDATQRGSIPIGASGDAAVVPVRQSKENTRLGDRSLVPMRGSVVPIEDAPDADDDDGSVILVRPRSLRVLTEGGTLVTTVPITDVSTMSSVRIATEAAIKKLYASGGGLPGLIGAEAVPKDNLHDFDFLETHYRLHKRRAIRDKGIELLRRGQRVKEQMRGTAKGVSTASSGDNFATGAKFPQSYTEPPTAMIHDKEATTFAAPFAPEVRIRINKVIIVDANGKLIAVAPLDATKVNWPRLRSWIGKSRIPKSQLPPGYTLRAADPAFMAKLASDGSTPRPDAPENPIQYLANVVVVDEPKYLDILTEGGVKLGRVKLRSPTDTLDDVRAAIKKELPGVSEKYAFLRPATRAGFGANDVDGETECGEPIDKGSEPSEVVVTTAPLGFIRISARGIAIVDDNGNPLDEAPLDPDRTTLADIQAHAAKHGVPKGPDGVDLTIVPAGAMHNGRGHKIEVAVEMGGNAPDTHLGYVVIDDVMTMTELRAAIIHDLPPATTPVDFDFITHDDDGANDLGLPSVDRDDEGTALASTHVPVVRLRPTVLRVVLDDGKDSSNDDGALTVLGTVPIEPGMTLSDLRPLLEPPPPGSESEGGIDFDAVPAEFSWLSPPVGGVRLEVNPDDETGRHVMDFYPTIRMRANSARLFLILVETKRMTVAEVDAIATDPSDSRVIDLGTISLEPQDTMHDVRNNTVDQFELGRIPVDFEFMHVPNNAAYRALAAARAVKASAKGVLAHLMQKRGRVHADAEFTAQLERLQPLRRRTESVQPAMQFAPIVHIRPLALLILNSEGRPIGTVPVDSTSTLADVRGRIKRDIAGVGEFDMLLPKPLSDTTQRPPRPDSLPEGVLADVAAWTPLSDKSTEPSMPSYTYLPIIAIKPTTISVVNENDGTTIAIVPIGDDTTLQFLRDAVVPLLPKGVTSRDLTFLGDGELHRRLAPHGDSAGESPDVADDQIVPFIPTEEELIHANVLPHCIVARFGPDQNGDDSSDGGGGGGASGGAGLAIHVVTEAGVELCVVTFVSSEAAGATVSDLRARIDDEADDAPADYDFLPCTSNGSLDLDFPALNKLEPVKRPTEPTSNLTKFVTVSQPMKVVVLRPTALRILDEDGNEIGVITIQRRGRTQGFTLRDVRNAIKKTLPTAPADFVFLDLEDDDEDEDDESSPIPKSSESGLMAISYEPAIRIAPRSLLVVDELGQSVGIGRVGPVTERATLEDARRMILEQLGDAAPVGFDFLKFAAGARMSLANIGHERHLYPNRPPGHMQQWPVIKGGEVDLNAIDFGSAPYAAGVGRTGVLWICAPREIRVRDADTGEEIGMVHLNDDSDVETSSSPLRTAESTTLLDIRPLMRSQLEVLASNEFTIMVPRKRGKGGRRSKTPAAGADGVPELDPTPRATEESVPTLDAMGSGGRDIYVRRHLKTTTVLRTRRVTRRRRKKKVSRKGPQLAAPALAVRTPLSIRVMSEDGETLLGTVTITTSTALAEIRTLITRHLRKAHSLPTATMKDRDTRVVGAFSELPETYDFLMPTSSDSFDPVEKESEAGLLAHPLCPEIRVRESGASAVETVRLVASGVEIGVIKVALDASLDETRRVCKRQLWGRAPQGAHNVAADELRASAPLSAFSFERSHRHPTGGWCTVEQEGGEILEEGWIDGVQAGSYVVHIELTETLEAGETPPKVIRVVASGVEMGTIRIPLDATLKSTRRVIRRHLWKSVHSAHSVEADALRKSIALDEFSILDAEHGGVVGPLTTWCDQEHELAEVLENGWLSGDSYAGYVVHLERTVTLISAKAKRDAAAKAKVARAKALREKKAKEKTAREKEEAVREAEEEAAAEAAAEAAEAAKPKAKRTATKRTATARKRVKKMVKKKVIVRKVIRKKVVKKKKGMTFNANDKEKEKRRASALGKGAPKEPGAATPPAAPAAASPKKKKQPIKKLKNERIDRKTGKRVGKWLNFMPKKIPAGWKSEAKRVGGGYLYRLVFCGDETEAGKAELEARQAQYQKGGLYGSNHRGSVSAGGAAWISGGIVNQKKKNSQKKKKKKSVALATNAFEC